jgi:hypothetical protein
MLLLAFFIQARDYSAYGNHIVRPAISVKEAFQGAAGGSAAAAEPLAEVAGGGLSPGKAGLENAREPYTLLNGWLEPKLPGEAVTASSPPGRAQEIPDGRYGEVVKDLYKETKTQPRAVFNSQTCFESDFQARLERTGNYRQLTNNYKRGDPDSCSAPLQDTAMGYYKVDAVPQTGCLSSKEWKRAAL